MYNLLVYLHGTFFKQLYNFFNFIFPGTFCWIFEILVLAGTPTITTITVEHLISIINLHLSIQFIHRLADGMPTKMAT